MKVIKISKKGTPQGDISFTLAINGKLIAIKGKENATANQFIQQYRAKGAKVIQKRDGVIVNIFPEGQTLFKLGQIEIDFEKDSDVIIENKLCQFYIDTYSKNGFEVE
jgi:hypothetical protein